jgi:hypothetical protein
MLGVPAAPALAQDELDEVLGGFDEEGAEVLAGEVGEESRWELTGAVALGSSINAAHDSPEAGQADYRGLSRLRLDLDLQLDVDLPYGWKVRTAGYGFRDFAYAIKGRDDFTHEVLDLYEAEIELDEAYLEGSLLENLDLKFGRQIVNWGFSDTLRVLDVLNPLDNREPGLVDIEDLRLPLTMTRLDYFWDRWRLTGIAVHESRFDKNPVPGSDFYPFPFQPLDEDTPANGGSDTEWAVALSGVFSGWDISFYWARFFDDKTHADFSRSLPSLTEVISSEIISLEDFLPPGDLSPEDDQFLQDLWARREEPLTFADMREVGRRFPSFVDDETLDRFLSAFLIERHSRISMLGFSANLALGNFLFKTEVAHFEGLEFAPLAVFSGFEIYELPTEDKSRTDIMVGVEYTGFDDTFIALEVVNRRIHAFDSVLEAAPNFAERNSQEVAFRYTADFAYDTLHLTGLAVLFGLSRDDGALIRISLDYDVFDAFTVGVGGLFFASGDRPPFDEWGDNDRLFVSAKYSF